jgi:probable F420-dependent oxidoreductase
MTAGSIRLGAKVPNSGPLPARIGIGVMAARLETAGFLSLWVSDHIVMPKVVGSRYPFAADGKATWPSDTDYYDALIALTYIASATRSARFGSAVLVLPQRNPVQLAKQVASLDALSGGRLELGIGAGWLAEEFAALEAPFAGRGEAFEEWIELMRACWTGEPVGFAGKRYTMPDGTISRPVPGHQVPLLIGGNTPRALERAGRLGDGWVCHQSAVSLDPQAVADGRRLAQQAAHTAGRNADRVCIVVRIIDSADRIEKVAAALPALAEAGADEIVVDVDWDRADGPEYAFASLSDALR